MASNDHEVRMMMSVYPGAMTGFAAMNAGLSSILNVFNGMTRAFDQQFGLVDAALTTTSVVVTQLGVDAMNAFGQFEQGMKIVQMVSGQTASDMDYLKQKANEFSVEYRTDIDQITEGLQTLGRAGLNTASEQAEVLENGLTTAKLEGRELNGVLQELIQNTTLLGGDLKSNEFGEDSQYVNDLLVATSMTAPITTHDISETLKYSGGIAAAAGAKIRTDTGEINEEGKRILEDYMGTIAAFAQKGVSGSIAGTALRAFLNKPATQDSSVTDALASIHLKPEYLWEEGEETMKPISEQIKLIQDQMDELNVSTMDRLQIWSKIVGGKMGQQMMKLDSEDITEITKDIQAADSASNLAAGSMKTYEANIKAAKESGAELQREVGEKLVYFANPWLEIGNKILDFMNMDFMSMPLALGVISFVGYLFTQIRRVAGTVRAEISNLLALTNEARAYMHQSMTGRAGMDKSTVGSFVSMLKDKEKASRKSWSEKAASEAGAESASSFKSYWESYSKGITESGPLSFSSLQKAGVTGDKLAAISRLQNLRSMDEYGLKDQDYVAAGLRYGYLTKEQEAKLISGAQQGMSPRNLFNSVFGSRDSEAFALLKQQLLADTEASRALGLAIDNETRARIAMMETFGPYAKGSFGGKVVPELTKDTYSKNIANYQGLFTNHAEKFNTQMNDVMMKTFGPNATGSFASRTIGVAQDTYANQIARAIDQGAIKSVEVVSFGRDTVVAEFNEMMAAISRTVSSTGKQVPKTSNAPILSSPLNMSSPSFIKGQAFLNDYYFPPGLNDIRNIFGIQKDIPVNPFAKNGMFYDETRGIYVSNFKDLTNELSKMPSTSRGGFDPKIQGAYTLDEKGRITTTPYTLGATNVPLPNTTPIMPSYVTPGVAPSVSEVETRLAQESAAAKQEEIVKINQEIATIQAEMDALYANTEATVKDEAAFQANAIAVDRMTASAEVFIRVMENSWKRAPQIGLTEDQKAKLSAMNHAADQRSLKVIRDIKTNQDRSKFQKSRENNNLITSRDEIKKIREDTKKQHQDLQEHRNRVYNNQNLGKYSGQYDALRKQYMTGEEIAKQNQDVIKRAQQNPVIMQNYAGNMGIAGGLTKVEKATQTQGFWASVTGRWNADRAGRINFGTKEVNGVLQSTTKGLRGFGNGLLNMTDLIGGPVMLAFMAIPAAINIWKGEFEKFASSLKEAGDKLNDAYSKWNSAEDALEQSYRDQNPDATDDEIEQMVLDTYSTMHDDMVNAINNGSDIWLKKINTAAAEQPTYEYDEEADDGTMKIVEQEIDQEQALADAIKTNTGALYEATAELNAAMSNYVRKGTDSWWGISGWTGQITDDLGWIQDSLGAVGIQNFISLPNMVSQIVSNTRAGQYDDNRFLSSNSKFTDNNEFLLTARQKDENYAGYTEMAGLMLQNFKDAGGNYLSGLQTMMGTDAITMNNVMTQAGREFMESQAKFASRLSQGDNLRLQTSMKQDSKTWKKLAKEIVKYEKKTGKKAKPVSTKKIEGLINKLNQSMGGQFDQTQILQAAYFEVMQGMLDTAKSVIVPILSNNSQIAAQTMYNSSYIQQSSSGTAGNSSAIAGINSAIAAMVAQIAMAQAAEATYNGILMQDPTKLSGGDLAAYNLAKESTDAQDFLKKASAKSYEGSSFNINWGQAWSNAVSAFDGSGGSQRSAIEYFSARDNQKAMDDILTNFGMSARMFTYNEDAITARDKVEKAITSWREDSHSSSQAIYESLSKIYQSDEFFNKLTDAYVSSGDDDEGSGGGGGGGGGSGSGDKDKDSGTKKERVDLVLCNKKEIPKLNVNLFKKAPSFTILNKNFKLRDIKVNTQDKPKAVLASIKNAIIDVQKRTDPKIIQDEEAIYDPVGATEGNTPSGTSDVKTNNN